MEDVERQDGFLSVKFNQHSLPRSAGNPRMEMDRRI